MAAAVLSLCIQQGVSAAEFSAARDTGWVASQVCSGCHGGSEVLPDLSGYSAGRIEQLMLAFKSDAVSSNSAPSSLSAPSSRRPLTLMNRLAKGYTDQEIAMIARALGKQ